MTKTARAGAARGPHRGLREGGSPKGNRAPRDLKAAERGTQFSRYFITFIVGGRESPRTARAAEALSAALALDIAAIHQQEPRARRRSVVGVLLHVLRPLHKRIRRPRRGAARAKGGAAARPPGTASRRHSGIPSYTACM